MPIKLMSHKRLYRQRDLPKSTKIGNIPLNMQINSAIDVYPPYAAYATYYGQLQSLTHVMQIRYTGNGYGASAAPFDMLVKYAGDASKKIMGNAHQKRPTTTFHLAEMQITG